MSQRTSGSETKSQTSVTVDGVCDQVVETDWERGREMGAPSVVGVESSSLCPRVLRLVGDDFAGDDLSGEASSGGGKFLG